MLRNRFQRGDDIRNRWGTPQLSLEREEDLTTWVLTRVWTLHHRHYHQSLLQLSGLLVEQIPCFSLFSSARRSKGRLGRTRWHRGSRAWLYGLHPEPDPPSRIDFTQPISKEKVNQEKIIPYRHKTQIELTRPVIQENWTKLNSDMRFTPARLATGNWWKLGWLRYLYGSQCGKCCQMVS